MTPPARPLELKSTAVQCQVRLPGEWRKRCRLVRRPAVTASGHPRAAMAAVRAGSRAARPGRAGVTALNGHALVINNGEAAVDESPVLLPMTLPCR